MKTFNNTRIIAVDTGYGNIKTASCIFSTGITRYDAEPIFEGNILEYQGAWYRIVEGHKAMLDDTYLHCPRTGTTYCSASNGNPSKRITKILLSVHKRICF